MIRGRGGSQMNQQKKRRRSLAAAYGGDRKTGKGNRKFYRKTRLWAKKLSIRSWKRVSNWGGGKALYLGNQEIVHRAEALEEGSKT